MRHLITVLFVLLLVFTVPVTAIAEKELQQLTTDYGTTLTVDPEEFRIFDVPQDRFRRVTGLPRSVQAPPKALAEMVPAAPQVEGRVLTILVEWENHLAQPILHPPSAYDELFYSTGTHPTGSVNDYY